MASKMYRTQLRMRTYCTPKSLLTERVAKRRFVVIFAATTPHVPRVPMLGVLTSSPRQERNRSVVTDIQENRRMGIALPSDLLLSLEDSCPCRSTQIRQLTMLYNVIRRPLKVLPSSTLTRQQDLFPPPRNLIVHGLQGTSKLRTVCSVLATREIIHTVVKSRECLSLRHLLSKIHTACIAVIYEGGNERAEEAFDSRTDSVNALGVNLQRLLQGRDEKLVLVLDGIDKQRGRNPNTLPALARLSDIVCAIATVLRHDADL